MMNGYVIPFGYSDGGMLALERLMKLPNAYLVDIRLSPNSKVPGFTKAALIQRFPGCYVHMGELGNRNYNNARPIELAYASRGIARLMRGIMQGYTIILMCGCSEYESCHRHTVVDLLQKVLSSAKIVMPDEICLPDTLKCLSIQQPWTWLIVNGFKDIENRDWTTSYRGPVLIHAGAKIDSDWFLGGMLYGRPLACLNIDPDFDMPTSQTSYSTKSIVGIVDLVNVVERSTSQWFVGRYGFVFQNARAFEKPIPYRGSLKLFDVSKEIVGEAL